MAARFAGGYATAWYHYDGRGNTSHLTDDGGHLVERYTYGLNGEPYFYNGLGQAVSASPSQNRFLFQGREYLPENGLYDFRNRFYHPTLARFMQPDAIGFAGDASNIYRFVGNNPLNGSDPSGLVDDNQSIASAIMRLFRREDTGTATTERIVVRGNPIDVLREIFDEIRQDSINNGVDANKDAPTGDGGNNGSDGSDRNETEKKDPCVITMQSAVNAARQAADLFQQFINPASTVLPRAVNIVAARPAAEYIFHRLNELSGQQYNAFRHQRASYELAELAGPTTARDMGVLHELKGLGEDLLFGKTGGFEFVDLKNNEIGIWRSILCE